MSLVNAGGNNTPNFDDVVSNVDDAVDAVGSGDALSIEDIVNTVTNSPKPMPRTQVSIYLDDDLAEAFRNYGESVGKGSRSDLVNLLLRQAIDKKYYGKRNHNIRRRKRR